MPPKMPLMKFIQDLACLYKCKEKYLKICKQVHDYRSTSDVHNECVPSTIHGSFSDIDVFFMLFL